MVTDQEHAALYSKLRKSFLSRHFAIGKYFRTNLFSQDCHLEGSAGASDFYGDHSLDPSNQILERWKRSRDSDNPLMTSGQFLTCLAVEDHLGQPQAGRILRSAILTLRSLYKFHGNHFDGYIIRWDPTTSDRWRTVNNLPQISDMFLVNQSGEYIFCIPSTDPRHVALRSRETLVKLMGKHEADRYVRNDGNLVDWGWDYYDRYRRWELSMDELVGLMTAYFMIHKLGASTSSRQEVARQVNNLGDYLAEHSYLLVRPVGGLNARGATGILPALEFPLVRAMKAITGMTYSARNNFMDVMKKAGYWESLAPPLANWTALGVVAQPLIMPLLANIIAPLGLVPFVPAIMPLVGIVAPAIAAPAAVAAAAVTLLSPVLARTFAIYEHRDCFDMSNDSSASEVAVAFFLMENFSPQTRFQGWMFGNSFTGGKEGSFATNFPPYLALTALDDPDPVVRDAYLNWLAERRRHPDLEPENMTRAESCFASAIAVLLGGGIEEEKKLKKKLEERYVEFMGDLHTAGKFGSDLAIEDSLKEDKSRDYTAEKAQPALDYMSGLALAWLHTKRCADAGTPVTTPGFPAVPSNIGFWPEPTVPQPAINAAQLDPSDPSYFPLPISEIQGTPTPRVDLNGAPLFDVQDAPQKSPIPPPVLPPRQTNLLYDKIVSVRERDKDVNTGIVLQNGDEYELVATGKIESGVILSDNGPNGWNNIVYDARFPLHGALDPVNAHPYCLLGRLGGYFFIGEKRDRERFLYHRECLLWLRINDDVPGNGTGSFQVRVRVWGKPRETQDRQISCVTISSSILRGRRRRRISHVGGIHPGGWLWRISVSEAIDQIEKGESFFVERPEGHTVAVIIGSKKKNSKRSKYLRTIGDLGKENNLRSLPRCSS